MDNSLYSKDNFNKNISNLQKKIVNKNGGNKDESNKRTFKVVELNGKIVDFGNFTIKKKTTSGNYGAGPISAAKKALQSIAKHLEVDKNKLNSNFMIQEITRGKNQYKIYGPYEGHYRKYTQKEMKSKNIHTKNGKIFSLEYEPVVKLEKSLNKNKKGGG